MTKDELIQYAIHAFKQANRCLILENKNALLEVAWKFYDAAMRKTDDDFVI